MISDGRKSSKAYLSNDETDVLYVVGTSLNVTAELPDSPSIVRKLGEAEARYSLVNESQTNLMKLQSSEPISIPGGGTSPRSCKGRPGSLSKNLSFSENVTMLNTSPVKLSRSLGTRDSYTRSSGRSSKSPGKERKVSRSFAKHRASGAQEDSSETSSDESQKPLVMKPIPGDKHRKVAISFVVLFFIIWD